jgi:NAD(P)-dependent dehydrogenase (short-subunit alcohol dehydrogenase family)
MKPPEDSPVVLVTGSARGLGREVARQLALTGAAVVVTAREPARAAATAEELRHAGDARALEVGLDVSDDASVRAAASELARTSGRLDVLVNNAAAYVAWDEQPSSADLAAAHAALETNLFGPWRTTTAFLPLLRAAARPRIVNVSSGAGSHADPDFGLTTGGGAAPAYGISKAALNALTSRFAAELADEGVLVNAVCPGLTATFPGAEQMGARPVEQSARGVVWAATLADDGPTGGFFRDGAPLGW